MATPGPGSRSPASARCTASTRRPAAVRRRGRRAVRATRARAARRCVPIAAGHFASVAAVAGAVLLGLSVDRLVWQCAAAALLALVAIVRFRRAPRDVAPKRPSHGIRGARRLVVHRVDGARRRADAGARAGAALRRKRSQCATSAHRVRSPSRSPRWGCMPCRCSRWSAASPSAHAAGPPRRCGFSTHVEWHLARVERPRALGEFTAAQQQGPVAHALRSMSADHHPRRLNVNPISSSPFLPSFRPAALAALALAALAAPLPAHAQYAQTNLVSSVARPRRPSPIRAS